MPTSPHHCPKCQSRMEQGFVPDYTHGAMVVGRWAAGTPKKSWLFGTHVPAKNLLIPIGTYRCSSCGYLEQYAREEFAAQ